jgi:hypothetical protein
MPIKPDNLPYHCSAGGSAVVGDGKSTITYGKDGAVISHSEYDTSYIYVPITNPNSLTAKLMKVEVECDGTNSGAVTEVWVHYSNNSILDDAVSPGDSDFVITAASSEEKADTLPYGINVTLKLSLPNSDSTLKLYSITLGFGDPDDSVSL